MTDLHKTETRDHKSWFQRLAAGLGKSSAQLTSGISELFTETRLDNNTLQCLEDLLITSDLGVGPAAQLTREIARTKFGKDTSDIEVRQALADNIATILRPVAKPLALDGDKKPSVILVVGINGAGKTTTIGKLANQFREHKLSVSLVAGDTYRAAAVDQLQVWGKRSGCPVLAAKTGADAASLTFESLRTAKSRGDDILLVDTAGRLQNKAHLMAELQKIVRVISKVDDTAPHATLLVLDATIGQNAHAQVEAFKNMVGITGLVVTKLDGTAKGGVVVALADRFHLPVHYVGIGENIEDLRPFRAMDFARGLLGLF